HHRRCRGTRRRHDRAACRAFRGGAVARPSRAYETRWMSARLRRWLLAASVAGALALASLFALPVSAPVADEQAGPFAVEINARPISNFRIGRDDRRFGPLEFVGGLEMTGSSRHFGASSAFRFLKPGSDFIGVADTGFWFFGRIERDADG